MDLNKLYYFYMVAKYQHITRAAEELHISQPALSKHMKDLETDLGVPLFCKRGRNIALTSFGNYLKEKADRVFSILDGVPGELEHMKGLEKNTIKLNVLAASTIITDAIVSYKKKNNRVLFQVIQNEEEMDCDISVTTNTVDFSRLPAFKKRCIMEEKIYLAVPKKSEYAKEESIDLRKVKDKGFVNLAGSRLFRTVCDRYCQSVGFEPKIVFESDSPIAVKNIIGAGAGIGFWPAFSWGKIPLDVKLLSIENPICQRELIIGLHNDDSDSEVVADFYDYLIHFLQRSAYPDNKRKN